MLVFQRFRLPPMATDTGVLLYPSLLPSLRVGSLGPGTCWSLHDPRRTSLGMWIERCSMIVVCRQKDQSVDTNRWELCYLIIYLSIQINSPDQRPWPTSTAINQVRRRYYSINFQSKGMTIRHEAIDQWGEIRRTTKGCAICGIIPLTLKFWTATKNF